MKYMLMLLLSMGSVMGGELTPDQLLAALQKARVDEEAASGKVYVQSEPPGASILLQVQGELRDLKCKTPSIVKLPWGMAVLLLRKEKFLDASLTVTVGDVLVKPNPVVLGVPKATVDVMSATPGWYVLLDGQLLKDKAGQLALTPCTLSLPIGPILLRLGKEGFSDIVERVSVAEGTTEVTLKSKEAPGKSLLLSVPFKELLAGRTYNRLTDGSAHPWLLMANGNVVDTDMNRTMAYWDVKEGKLVLTSMMTGGVDVLSPDGNGGFRGDGIRLIPLIPQKDGKPDNRPLDAVPGVRRVPGRSWQ